MLRVSIQDTARCARTVCTEVIARPLIAALVLCHRRHCSLFAEIPQQGARGRQWRILRRHHQPGHGNFARTLQPLTG
jgi:hypothetical protein